MKKHDVKKMFSCAKVTAIKRAPEILIGVGIAGLITAGILAVKETPKAVRLIEEAKTEIKKSEHCNNVKLTPMETVKATWKCYLPSTITAVLSAGCIISAGAVHSKRNAALATALSLSETTLREYGDKVVEIVGKKKEREIRDAIAEDNINKNPPKVQEIVFTGKGTTHCFDPLTGRTFDGDIEYIRKVENIINKRLRDEMAISLNEFYMELGLDPVDGHVGDKLGWNIDKGFIELHFTSTLINDVPFLVISHVNPPTYMYNYFN